jgi:hypothetical protein
MALTEVKERAPISSAVLAGPCAFSRRRRLKLPDLHWSLEQSTRRIIQHTACLNVLHGGNQEVGG